MSRHEQKMKENNYKSHKRKKKMLIFILVFLFFQGVFIVDHEYSNLMGVEKEMVLGCKRIDSEMIKIYLLGNDFDMNSKEVVGNIEKNINIFIGKAKISLYKMKRKWDNLVHDKDLSPKDIQMI